MVYHGVFWHGARLIRNLDCRHDYGANCRLDRGEYLYRRPFDDDCKYCKIHDGRRDSFSIKRSAGAGVRIFLPMIGMLGIDWAYGFDNVFGNRGGSHFHFVLGQEF